jgi:PAS domain S-box-containing protein
MKILVVDDETESRTLLEAILTAEGYEVRAADAGELALASMAVSRPELILLDIRMPGMDGFEVCRRIKQNVDTRDIPLIFLSASKELSERVEGFRLGAVDYLTKPFQREELLARVHTHLELGGLRAHLETLVAERTAELRESEQRFHTMADAAPVMIWTSDTDKLCTFINKRWLEFTGRSVSQELGNGWASGVHPDDLERCLDTYRSAFDARRNFEMEYRVLRADGEYRWVFDKGVPRFAPGGVFSGYIGSCTDITDLKQYHNRMLAAQKMESLGLMAAGVAHDFGNMLGAILWEIDLALSEMEPESPARENVQRIEILATHASEIIGMLRASAGGSIDSSPMEPLDLSSLVEQTLQLLTISVSKRLEIRTSLPRHLSLVRGHITQIRQVIVNLVTNAAEALNSHEGLITITTDRVSLNLGCAANWANLPPGEYVRLTVSDTGCGMTAVTRAKIFDQFFTTKSSGRGLGLAVVSGIVHSHGGAINVVSEPGAGTTFELLFPSISNGE